MEYFGRIPVRLADVDVASAVRLAERYGIYAYHAYVLECAVRYRTELLTLDHAQAQVGRDLGLEVVEV